MKIKSHLIEATEINLEEDIKLENNKKLKMGFFEKLIYDFKNSLTLRNDI